MNDTEETLPRTNDYFRLYDGTGVTECCGAMATFSDIDLCCKMCWNPVGDV